jgi:prephenate dehydratase
MRRNSKLVVQGFPGSFHDEVARAYFGHNRIETIPAKSFNELAQILEEDTSINYGVMAIENSIAGSILQNYKILREHKFWISGEAFLRINHQLMAIPGQSIEDIHTVRSHPMAIYQCHDFFAQHRHISLIESADTALSAKEIADTKQAGMGAIASRLAAELYGLEIIASNIETSKVNYTRFVIISKEAEYSSLGNANKASIYLRVPHRHGSLLAVLQQIADFGINISKLQSFPVLGEFNTYYFHLDLEFDNITQYEDCIEEIRKVSNGLEELGIYKKAVIHDHQAVG